MDVVEVVDGFLGAATTQAQLIITLSISVIGGSLALLVQLILFNRGRGNEKISFPSRWLLTVGFAFLGITILVSYLLLGNIASIRLPMLMFDFDNAATQNIANLSDEDVPGIGAYRTLTCVQFGSFFWGALPVLYFWARLVWKSV